MSYTTHLDRFVDPARARPQIWRIILGILVMLAVYIALVALVTLAVVVPMGVDVNWLVSREAMANPWALLWLLSTFLGMAAAPLVAVRLVHRRRFATLFGRGAVVLRDFAVAGGTYLVIALPITAIWVFTDDVSLNLNPLRWLSFLPLALVAIAVQTLSEEMVFRGYFLQQLAARFRSRFAWMILPSLVFGALHFNGGLPTFDAVAIVVVITLFGLVAADLTARTGSLGAAWGFHFVNNIIAMLFISVEGSMTGLSLFKTGYAAQDGLPAVLFVLDAILIVAGWGLMRKTLRR